MTLHSGTRLGPYEVIGLIGKGGMGEVYRATDTNLPRQVAVKVLPASFAEDPDRLVRFEREAGILAQLNHPNIAHVHSFEKSAGMSALVMELVEGPTLADRIAQGPIPLDEALPIATQIAEAVEAAHEQGIIHRDLKPGNIKLRADGVVKVLDFGLAKALDPAPASDLSQSPTVTSPAMTRAGLILGTASYMSPEQARGLRVDRATDIWAWGCVLYEMLTGERAFGGADTTEVIASVVRGQPDWPRLPADTPASVSRLLRRCVEKDRKRRLADIRDARFVLEDAQQEPAVATLQASAPGSRRGRIAWVGALGLGVLAASAAVVWAVLASPATDPLPSELRLEITTPSTTDLASMALSPDGEKIVFVASSRGRPMLWLRSLVTGEARPFDGTDGATFPFWSPNSRSIGFFADNHLYRIDVDGGSLRQLAAVPVAAGGTWSRDGVILFTIVPDGPIHQVPDDGGGKDEPVPGSERERGKGGDRFPCFLPDGRRYLYYKAETNVRGVYVGTLDGPERRHLFDADSAAVFVPPAEVLFLRGGALVVQRVDPLTLAPEGEPVRVATGVALDNQGAAAVSASTTGAIAYRVGTASRLRQIMWVDRSGTPVGDALDPDPNSPLNPALSPDARLLAVNRGVAGNNDIWVLDMVRHGAMTKMTSAPTPDISPVWSPKGDRIAYGGFGRGGFDLLEIRAASPGKPAVLSEGPLAEVPLDWSNDGRFLLYRTQVDPATGIDLWAVPLEGDRTPIVVARTAADETAGAFSPDGTWVAIVSNETGRHEIYLQPFPGPGARIPVSTGGGQQPRWRPDDGKELFYVAPDGRLMSVALGYSPDGRSVEPASPVPLFVTRVSSAPAGGSRQEYAVSPDGQRFLMNTLVEQAGAPITVVLRHGR